ncbi:MAG: CHAT domain-containing protein [Armatimonadetes bacterium]|nr:CHAT domain-containing protein [Armatimonadota bacterium]
MSAKARHVAALLFMLSLWAPTAHPATAAPLDDLRTLFTADPALAFQQAADLLDACLATEDLAQALEVFRVVGSRAAQLQAWAPWDAMAARVEPMARQRGDWKAVEELLTARVQCQVYVPGGLRPPYWGRGQHFVRLFEAARQARQKAGLPPSASSYEGLYEELRALSEADPASYWIETQPVSAILLPIIRTVEEAGAAAQYSDMHRGVLRLIQQLEGALDAGGSDLSLRDYTRLAHYIGTHIGQPGGEAVVPPLRQLVDRCGDANTGGMTLEGVMEACARRWSGRDDVFRDTFYWSLTHFRPARHQPPVAGVGLWCQKLAVFGREGEAVTLVHRLMGMAAQRGPGLPAWGAHRLLWRGSPDSVLQQVLDLTVREGCDMATNPPNWYPHPPLTFVKDFAGQVSEITRLAPDERRPVWARKCAEALQDMALSLEDAAAVADGLNRAADVYEQGSWTDPAEECRALAAAIASSDPTALLQSGLMAARSAASAGDWGAAIRRLADVTAATQGPSVELLQAALLLQEAYLRLGRADDAERWFTRAHQLVHSLPLSAAEKANYLVSMAALCDLATGDAACIERKTFLLQQAEAAAKEAGLDLLREKISSQLADVALVGGDLETAKTALIQIVDRTETRREQLAFDPVLRQHWFADNIGPYRKLMRVAALTNDPLLALSCAERMRARALVDQLSWQKVDMAVNLAPETQERLKRLRAMRKEAYGLLQQALGGGKPEVETDDLRGKYMPIRGQYMPIRGMYMPIRGPLDRNVLASEADIAHLKELLGKLASEEAAIESAVREQVPAYEMASATRVPTGQEIADAVAAHPKLGVLHYTFTDQGLAVVAMGPGGGPKVAHIEVSGDALWERIGKFREMIWERKVEAFQEAADLFTLLVLPVYGVLPGAERVWVIADGALQLVPFGALLGLDKVFLAYHCAVATAPSLSLALVSRGERPAAGKPALVVAAPDTGALSLAGDDTRGKYMPIRGMYMPVRGAYMPIRGEEGVSSALTAMAMIPLPGAKAEGEAIADMIPGSELVSGKEATKERLLAEGSDCGLLHIATHGYADPDFPEFSGLLLASGDDVKPYDVLTAQEVYTWPLKARLVTLSACQTALGKDVEGEGLLGLSRAFIYAGAQDVLCSLWPVSDESTKTLMTAFYKGLAEGQSVENALRSAQRALMQVTETNHPFFWAGFTAVRGPE